MRSKVAHPVLRAMAFVAMLAVFEFFSSPLAGSAVYWDANGTVEDLRLLGEVGYRVANGKTYPAWKAGSEFKAKRDATMK